MLSVYSSLTLSRALKRSVHIPYSKLLLSNFKPNDTLKWQDVLSQEVLNPHPLVLEMSEEEDSYMGYRLQGVRIITRVEGSEDPLPTLEEGDVLFYLLVNGLKATEEIKKMGAVRVKFFEGCDLLNLPGHFMWDCAFLEEVSFGKFNVLKSIGPNMLTNCKSLNRISFDGLSSVEVIHQGMLTQCSSLTNVSFEGLSSLVVIGDLIFHNCTSLRKVSFHGLKSLKIIGCFMFSKCTSLDNLSFKGLESVEIIQVGMFRDCTSLVHVSFDGLGNLTQIGFKKFKKGDYLQYIGYEKAFKNFDVPFTHEM
jgi:hypothetical protein